MKLEKVLYTRSYLYFLGFFLFALIGFWFTYFTRFLDQENYRMHLHGISVFLWCLMLILQAYLIRINARPLHRALGKFSYLLVPVILFSTVELLHYKVRDVVDPDPFVLFFVALVLNALVVFVLFYGLAIYHRNQPTVHARFMLCTVFPMFTPITDRIINIYFPSVLKYLPTLHGKPIEPTVGFLLADLLLVGLSIWDWRAHQRWNVFPFALLALLLYHVSVLTFHAFPFWKSFSDWFISLY